MRVLILGGDGYLGWPTAMRFSGQGHDVAVVDNFARRRWVEEAGASSLTPIASFEDRIDAWRRCPARPSSCSSATSPRERSSRRRAGVRARHDHPLRRAADRSVVDEDRRPCRRHPGEQRGRRAEAALGDARLRARRTPRQARHDGRVRHAQHRHRGGLHRDRAQGAQGHTAVPQAARLALPPLQGARLAQHPFRLPGLGAPRHRSQPGRRLRHRDRRRRGSTNGL